MLKKTLENHLHPINELLFDLKTKDGRPASWHIAKGFDLEEDDANAAIEALMPAFAEGLKRNVTTEQGLHDLMSALAYGNHIRYLEKPEMATSLEGIEEGNAILGHILGSKQVSRAVASHAQNASGLSQSALKKMLPSIAPFVMGGLFQQIRNSDQASNVENADAMYGAGILGHILEELIHSSPNKRRRGRHINPFEDIVEQMMGGKRPSSHMDSERSRETLGRIFRDMLKDKRPDGSITITPEPDGKMVEPLHEKSPQRHNQAKEADNIFTRAPKDNELETGTKQQEEMGYPPGTGFDNLFGDLFKPSKSIPPDYGKKIEDIFNEFEE